MKELQERLSVEAAEQCKKAGIRLQGKGGIIHGGEDKTQGRGDVGVAQSKESRGQRRGRGVQEGERMGNARREQVYVYEVLT